MLCPVASVHTLCRTAERPKGCNSVRSEDYAYPAGRSRVQGRRYVATMVRALGTHW